MAVKTATLSLTDIAAEMEVTTRTIQNYVRDGMPHRREKASGDPRFVARECQRWRREREIEAAVEKERARLSSTEKLDKDKEMAEKVKVERQIKEIELLELRGKKIDIDLYQERIEAFVGGFAGVAAGQLHQFERQIIAATNASEARRLTDEIHRKLMEGAQEYAEMLEAEMAATEVEAA